MDVGFIEYNYKILPGAETVAETRPIAAAVYRGGLS